MNQPAAVYYNVKVLLLGVRIKQTPQLHLILRTRGACTQNEKEKKHLFPLRCVYLSYLHVTPLKPARNRTQSVVRVLLRLSAGESGRGGKH